MFEKEDKPLRICVLGFGSWGTSISKLLALNGHQITSWTRDERVIKSMQWHENPYYFPGKKLPDTVKITNDLQKATLTAEIIVIAIPTQVMRKVLSKIDLSGKFIIN